MPVTVLPDGRRAVTVAVDLPVDPAVAWKAVATGEGVTGWFCPTTIEGREGGRIDCDFGGGMTVDAVVVQWDAPRSFTAVSSDTAPGVPPFFTRWSVEEGPPGGCRVRVEHWIEAGDDGHDAGLLDGERGWPGFFESLLRFVRKG